MIYYLLILFFILSIFYFYFLISIKIGLRRVRKNKYSFQNNYFVSIIIPFRNEEEKILSCLESIEKQDFDKSRFEVIFVNDFSEDDSLYKIRKVNKSNNIKIISVPHGFSPNSHKKRAIKYGIENSKGEIIVTTDADCSHSSKWLSTLVSYFDDETGFVSAPIVFLGDKSFFHEIQKLEFAGLILTGAGLIGYRKPTICNGANLAYKENAFSSVNGFNDNFNLSSGDDEFLMQKISKQTKYKIRFCFEKEAVNFTHANKNINEFYQQRKRWASKGLFYSDKLLIIKLFLIYFFFLSFPVQLILGIVLTNYFLMFVIFQFVIKLILEYLIMKEGMGLLYDKINFKFFLLAELLHCPYILISGLAGAFGNIDWKNRSSKR